jgi:flagellar biosynthesis/type III secretory pathway protein FliH
MSYFLWQRDAALSIASNRRVLRASEMPSLEQAAALCARLDAMVRDQPTQLAEQIEHARAEGYARGLEQGRAAAREETATALTAMSQTLQATREQLHADTATLALAVVHKLMGRFSSTDRLAGLADTAAREAVFGAGETKPALTLTVHPDQVDAVREQLAARSADQYAPPIEVQDDPGCGPQTCRLDSELGSVEATLDVQLARLAQAWNLDANLASIDDIDPAKSA